MKRLGVVVLAVVLLLPGAGAGADPAAYSQEESGTVIGPTPHPQAPEICFQGVGRRIYLFSQGAYTGPVFGSIFDIDEKTWNGRFKLDITSHRAGNEDLDIYFFKDFGPWIPEDPIANSPTILAVYEERNTEGEQGIVPKEATKAMVCLWSGIQADYDYEAKPPSRKKVRRKRRR
jgi:hypothetical protein